MRERSFFQTILAPLLVLLFVEALAFAASLYASGVLSRLDTNDRALLDKQSLNRASFLESRMTDTVRELDALAEQIDYAGYTPSTRDMIAGYMNRTRERTGATDVFLITETDAPATNADYYFQPYDAAANRQMQRDPSDPANYAWWGLMPSLGGADEADLCCTVPLIAGYGAPYGVVGVRFTQADLERMMPSDELLFENEGFYQLCTGKDVDAATDTEIDLTGVAHAGAYADLFTKGGAVQIRAGSQDNLSCTMNGTVYYVALNEIRPYLDVSPFGDTQWFLIGSVPTDALYGFSTQVVRMITLTALIMLAVGAIGSLLISRRIAGSVQRLSGEVVDAQMEKQEIPRLSLTGIREIDQFAGAITSLSRDIMDQRALERKRIERERDYDQLTGLLNLSAYQRNCARIFATPDLLGVAAIIMLDVDNVKEINDAYGHDKGDMYIRLAAKTFLEATPGNTLVAKVAGDEFYIMYYGYENRGELERQIDLLRKRIADTRLVLSEEDAQDLSITGGVAWYPDDGATYAELTKYAEFKTFQLKKSGKGLIADFDRNEYAHSASAIKKKEALQTVLENHNLIAYHFQPIFDAATGQVHAYESLIRSEHENLKYPAEILELARQERRLMDIERITWTRSFECYRELLKNGLAEPNAYLLINSVSSLCLPDDEMRMITEKNRDLLGRTVIEITESEHMNEEATAKKRAIKGFSGYFALDDYGSGYNSEKTLLELVPKYIKVDLSIIRDIDSSPDKQRIVSNLVRYAHERDMYIVAEGIETQEEMETVIEIGVDLLQGYYLARGDRVPPALSAEASETLDRRGQFRFRMGAV